MANHVSAMPVDNNSGKGEMLSIGSFSCVFIDSSVEILIICPVYSVFLLPWLCTLSPSIMLFCCCPLLPQFYSSFRAQLKCLILREVFPSPLS